ncbi:hypothetical protein HDV06_000165 [Boothiomyces sp. JEL0866]|nr:hypothetical protein HDV06_000165 [Boothiomyces sp. JEL0866]
MSKQQSVSEFLKDNKSIQKTMERLQPNVESGVVNPDCMPRDSTYDPVNSPYINDPQAVNYPRYSQQYAQYPNGYQNYEGQYQYPNQYYDYPQEQLAYNEYSSPQNYVERPYTPTMAVSEKHLSYNDFSTPQPVEGQETERLYAQPRYSTPETPQKYSRNSTSGRTKDFGNVYGIAGPYSPSGNKINSARPSERSMQQVDFFSPDTVVLKEDIDETLLKPIPRKYCCCFTKRSTCIITVAIIILALLGIIIYLFVPQAPNVTSSDFYVPSGTEGVLLNGVPLSQASKSTTNTFQFNMAVNVSVESFSYFKIGIHQLSVDIAVKDTTGSAINGFVGSGSANDLAFPPRANTTFVLPSSVSYTVSSNTATDPAILLMEARCIGQKAGTIPASLTFKVDVSAISWLGIKPSYTWDKAIPCPSQSQLQAAISIFSK